MRRLAAIAAVLLAHLLAAPATGQAAITVVGSASASTWTSTLTVAVPSGTVAGQVMVAVVSGYGTGPFAAPAGWVTIQDTTSGSLRQLSLYRIAGASEPSSYSFTSQAYRAASGGIATFAGVNPTVPVDASSAATGASGDAVTPSVTTSSAGDMIVAASSTSSYTSFTPPSGMTELWDRPSWRTTAEVAVAVQPQVGASGSMTAVPGSAGGAWAAHTIALRDVATAGLSVSAVGSASFSTNLDGGDATASYTIPITVLDTRSGADAGLGWNLTVTSTTLSTGSRSLPTGASRATGLTTNCLGDGSCVAPVNATTYPVDVPAGAVAPPAAKLASVAAGTGQGAFSVSADVAVSVPQNSFSGSYGSTVTIAVVSGP